MNCPQKALFALVVLEPPKDDFARSQSKEWQEFLNNLPHIEALTKNTKKIGDHTWQISLETDMLFLAHLLILANNKTIPLCILFLHEEPAWIKQPPAAPKPDVKP